MEWQEHGLWDQGVVRTPALLLPSSMITDEIVNLSVPHHLISKVGVNSAYTSCGADLIAQFTDYNYTGRPTHPYL